MSATSPTLRSEPTTAEKLARLPWSIASNAANTVFVQFTFFGSAFVLFLNQLNLNNTQIGFLLSLFPFFGLVALVIAPAVARFGYKRTYLLFFGTRKFVTALLLLVPWVLTQFGGRATTIYLTFVVMGFALCRAIAETAVYPWIQEYVPNSVRGKYSASNNIFARLVGVVAVTIASLVIESSEGLNRFMVLFGVGAAFGLVAVFCASFIPGGAPLQDAASTISNRDLLKSARDGNFRQYLLGLGVITIATNSAVSFLPLYMEQQIGISEGRVLILQNSTLIGGLLSTYLWGWAADRYGSKPVMLSGVYLRIVLPVCWMLIPRGSENAFIIALAISFLQGIAEMGWVIGSARLLYVSVVPAQMKTEYMAVYYAAIGIFGGVSQLIGGRILDFSAGLSGQFYFFTLDPFTPLFAGSLVLTILSLFLFRTVRADSSISMGEFAGLFFRGNPFSALGSMMRYYMAKDERATVAMTKQLGQTDSPIAVEELLDALNDPRFNVRFEAIISMARTKPDPRLVNSLRDVLNGTELALSVMAAWALGRIGDEHALRTLREGLHSEYRSIRAHCARALGTLNDQTVAPYFLQQLEGELDKGLQMAYASALGHLGYKPAVEPLLQLLETTQNEGARLELALSLARIFGEERQFIQLLRQLRADTGTAASQTLSGLKRKLARQHGSAVVIRLFDRCAEAFARNQFDEGVTLLVELIQTVTADHYTAVTRPVLRRCATLLQEEPLHLEYLLLTLYTLEVGWQDGV